MVAALNGINILEIGDGVAPAYCGRLLADLGARVTKMESSSGDRTRQQAGGYLFDVLNRGKEIVTDSDSMDRMLARAAEADVVVESLSPEQFAAARDRLLALVDRGVIVASLSVFGRQGPYAGDKGFALQALAGSVAYRMGDPDRAPLVFPFEGGDYVGAVAAANGVLLAMLARRRGVAAQWVDISSMEVIHQFFNRMALSSALPFRPRGARGGHRSPNLYPWVTLKCADGYVCVCTLLKKHWDRYAEAIGHPEWIDDPERDTRRMDLPLEIKEELDAGQEEWMRTRTRPEMFEFFQSLRVPFHPVNDIDATLNAEQLEHRRYWAEFATNDGRTLRAPAALMREAVTGERSVTAGRSSS